MNNRQATRILKSYSERARKHIKAAMPAFQEALALAIAALLNPMLDKKRAGALGGQATVKKYGKKKMSTWGKLGGRPKKKVG